MIALLGSLHFYPTSFKHLYWSIPLVIVEKRWPCHVCVSWLYRGGCFFRVAEEKLKLT